MLQNFEKVYFCGFKPPNLWYFVTLTLKIKMIHTLIVFSFGNLILLSLLMPAAFPFVWVWWFLFKNFLFRFPKMAAAWPEAEGPSSQPGTRFIAKILHNQLEKPGGIQLIGHTISKEH